MSQEKWFPFRDLNESEIENIIDDCGGLPLNNVANIFGFFKNLAKPMIQDHLIIQLLKVASISCSENYDINVSHGSRLFHYGAFLYSGVLAEVSPLIKIPCEPSVYLDICHSNGEELIWASKDQLKENTPNFCNLLAQASSGLDICSSIDMNLAIAGAGLIHILTKNSINYEEAKAFEEDHLELLDLEDAFQRIDNLGFDLN